MFIAFCLQVALADDTQRISLTTLPTPLAQEPEDDARELEITAQYQSKPVRKSHQWIGLEVLPSGVLSALSSGIVNLHPFNESRTSHTASVLSPIACLRTVPTQSASGPSQMVLAGKNVELSMWDMERTFAVGSKAADNGKASSKKRKKGELEEGEIWRAKHVSRLTWCCHAGLAILHYLPLSSYQTITCHYLRLSITPRCVSSLPVILAKLTARP
jgi:hypothetical protein